VRSDAAAPADWSLYLVTDPVLGGGPGRVPAIVDAAVAGGVSIVQLRDKTADAATFTARAARLRDLLVGRGVPLFVNDRVRTAVELGLHLHIGQDDLPYREARRLLPETSMIGLSVETSAHLEAVARDITDGVRPPDVLGIGPVRQTATKPDAAAPLGIGGFAELAAGAARLGIPAVAIGAVRQDNAADLVHAGAAGICTVSAVMAATDPRAAAHELRTLVDATRVDPTRQEN
jgi:thiamine-phosphate pyrophosphorylase